MDAANTQKSALEPNIFQIPVEEYEKDMEMFSKEKKKEILDLFTNYYQLKTISEFKEVKTLLHDACQVGDLEFIKILLSETIANDPEDLYFKIDKENKTASLFKISQNNPEVVIPRTVKYELNDYLVTSVTSLGLPFFSSLDINTVKFEEDSAVATFYQKSLEASDVEEIYFPKSLKELKKGWCFDSNKLTKITVSPLNDQFIFKDDKYLLGKSDKNKNEFDILYFARRDIDEISLPPSVTIIREYAFSQCTNITKIEIPTNSNLQTIERNAFEATSIEEIYFPKSLTKLEKYWCLCTQKLTKITVSPLNDQFIFKDDKYLLGKSDKNKNEFDILYFARRDIDEISLPPSVTIIREYAFSQCTNITKIEIPKNSNLQTIEENAFTFSNLGEIFLPSSVTKICEYAFSQCRITKVSFSSNINLQIIDDGTFLSSNIIEISIPPSVTKICKDAFNACENLTKVEIPMNSNLQIIEEKAFAFSNIEEIYFPKSLTKLEEGWCLGTEKLTKIIVSPLNDHFIYKDDKYLLCKSDQNKNEFDILYFARRDIDEISLPSNIKIIASMTFQQTKIKEIYISASVTRICKYAFAFCDNLRKVKIPENSNLQIIEEKAFVGSNIEEIFIPSSVTKICKNAFDNCFNLRKVDIPTNSNLQVIEERAFEATNIKDIFIPSNLTKIDDTAFFYCRGFHLMEIAEGSKLKTISEHNILFLHSQKTIVMIPPSLKELIHNITQNDDLSEE